MEFAILDFIQTLRNPILDQIIVFITSLGNDGILNFIMLGLLLINKKTRRLGIVLGVAMIINYLITNLTLKPLVARTRPYDINTSIVLLVDRLSSYSFPSGHSAAAFTLASSFYFNKNKFGKWLFIFAIIMAFTRLYLYVHFPTDVLAGAFIGIFNGYMANIIVNKISIKLGK